MTARNYKTRVARAKKMTVAEVLERVDAERENLGRAISLLVCLAVALEHGDDLQTGPCYYEVAELGWKMIAKSMEALEPGVLTGVVT